MPWQHLLQHLPRHVRRQTTEPSTGLHGIPWNPYPNPKPNPNPGAVGIGVPWGVAMKCREVAMECRGSFRRGCHGTTHRMQRHPARRHGILIHALGCRGNAMVCYGRYHGHAMKMSKQQCRTLHVFRIFFFFYLFSLICSFVCFLLCGLLVYCFPPLL